MSSSNFASSLSFVQSKLIFESWRGHRHTITDFANFLSNKSRISFHQMEGQPYFTVPELILELSNRYNQIAAEEDQVFSMDIVLLLALIANQLTRTPKPVKLLEIGCGSGLFSYLAGTLLGQFSPDSSLYCLSDIIEPAWLDKIALIENPPHISYMASDYDFTNLERQSFDIVVLNGFTVFEDPHAVVKEAIRVLKPDGVFISFANDSPLLDSLPALYFKKRERYEVTPIRVIQLMHGEDCWKQPESPKPPPISALLDKIGMCLDDNALFDVSYRDFIRTLDEYADWANKEYEVQHKQHLLELKENILDVVVNKDAAHRAFYVQSLRERLNAYKAFMSSTLNRL